MRLDALGQIGGSQPFKRLLARLGIGRALIERQHDKRKTELRVREHAHHVRQAVEHGFNRHRDLLLDLFRRAAGIKRNDVHLDV